MGSYTPPLDAESRLLAAGVVLHKGGDLSLQLSYRNQLGPWVRKHFTEWAAEAVIDPAELKRRLRDPAGCWPSTVLLAPPAKAKLYELRRDGYNGKPLAEHLRDLGITEQTLLQRLNAPERWDLVRALNAPNAKPAIDTLQAAAGRPPVPREKRERRRTLYTYDGVTATLGEHCARVGLSYYTLMSRIRSRTVNGVYYPAMTIAQALRLGAARKQRCDKGGKRGEYQRSPQQMLFGTPSKAELTEAARKEEEQRNAANDR